MFKHFRPDHSLLRLARALLYAWVRTRVLPASKAELDLDPAVPVVYVLNRRFLSNLLVLSREAEALGLQSALAPFLAGDVKAPRSFFFLSRPAPWFGKAVPAYSSLLRQLVLQARADPGFDVQIVPVSILWGRAPDKENSVWKLLFADDWDNRGRFRRLFTIALHGRQTLVRFSEPLSLHQIVWPATGAVTENDAAGGGQFAAVPAGPFADSTNQHISGDVIWHTTGSPIGNAIDAVAGHAAAIAPTPASQPVPDVERLLRKLSRILRVHFRRQRELAIGPDLSHRRTQLEALLQAPRVRAAAEATAKAEYQAADELKGRELVVSPAQTQIQQRPVPDHARPQALARAHATARSYAWEIASDYSFPVVRIGARFLDWLWTRLYDGVEVANFDTVTDVAPDHEIIYVPSHRSHIDYLLLSWLVFNHGMMVPHIAAGANLNLPVVGGILRRGGAFFLRRSFKGNQLYAAVFNEYLHMMISKGYPIEYFVEGGRSRTGRLLAPMAGMLAMTVQSFLRGSTRPIVFLPVYIGYEKLFEGRTYIGELMGQPKKKESLLDLLLTVRELNKNFGKVHVSFGEPIRLTDLLDQANPHWREQTAQEAPGSLPPPRPAWLTEAIEQLRNRIADGINDAAVVNPVSLCSLVLLATPRQAMDAGRLARQLDACRQLLLLAPYAPRTAITPLDGEAIIAYCEKLKLIRRHSHALGDIVTFDRDEAVLATYARNNILHVVALPALAACLLSHNIGLPRADLRRLAHTVYPFLQAELTLRWSDTELDDALDVALTALRSLGWLEESGPPAQTDMLAAPGFNSEAYASLSLLGQAVRPGLIRYFITLTMLTQRDSGSQTAAELELLCHLQAQRLALLSEFNAPEFFDKAVFRNFIVTLTERGLVKVRDDGRIHFGASLRSAAAEARFVLPPEVRQTILQITRPDASRDAA